MWSEQHAISHLTNHLTVDLSARTRGMIRVTFSRIEAHDIVRDVETEGKGTAVVLQNSSEHYGHNTRQCVGDHT